MSAKSYWWLRLAIAAFVLSAWVVVGVGSGIARADDPSPKGDTSTSESSPAPHQKTPKKPKPTSDATPTAPDTTADTNTDQDAATAEKPADKPKPHTRHSTWQPHLTIASTKPSKTAKPAPSDPAPTATATAATQSVVAPGGIAGPSATAKVTAVTPQTSAAFRLPKPREVVGLVSDVGVVGVSVVYTAADTIAQIFGPHSFLGAPYALATAVANSAAAVGRTLIGAPPGSAGTGAFPVTYGILDGLRFFMPQVPPPGANDPSIKVTPQHPLPIILLNGTTTTQGVNWSVGAPVLANAGYKVYTFNYGNITSNPNSPIQATDDIRNSGEQLSAEVKKVLEETGAPKVILIGHSQGGGILPAYYINNLDGADKVSQVIGIAPSNHGTDAMGLIGLQALPILGPLVTAFANALGPALEQQSVGNDFQQEVYGNGDTRPGILYTTITSTHDEIVTPYTQQALDGPGVTNIVLQDLYPNLPAGHLGVVLSPQVWSVVLDALAANPAANPLAPDEALVA